LAGCVKRRKLGQDTQAKSSSHVEANKGVAALNKADFFFNTSALAQQKMATRENC